MYAALALTRSPLLVMRQTTSESFAAQTQLFVDRSGPTGYFLMEDRSYLAVPLGPIQRLLGFFHPFDFFRASMARRTSFEDQSRTLMPPTLASGGAGIVPCLMARWKLG